MIKIVATEKNVIQQSGEFLLWPGQGWSEKSARGHGQESSARNHFDTPRGSFKL
jgi:hypothetical protein